MIRTKTSSGMRRTKGPKRIRNATRPSFSGNSNGHANSHGNGECLSRRFDIPMPEDYERPDPRGQVLLYRPQFAEYARHMCRLGATDGDLARAFGVSIKTIESWQARWLEFNEATRIGKGEYDDQVERRLAMRAMGYSYESEKIFCHNGEIIRVPITEHVPPDTGAAIFWLKNRKRGVWKDKFDHEHHGDLALKSEVGNLSSEQLEQIESILRQSAENTNGVSGGSGTGGDKEGEGEEGSGSGTPEGGRWTNSFH